MGAGKPQPPPEPSAVERLDSWKEIAAYLKRDESTVRRWEKEGLPVHRHVHKRKATIYAYKAEIDVWWSDGRSRLEAAEAAVAERRGPAIRPRAGVAAAAVALLLLLAVWFVPRFWEEAPLRVVQLTTLPGLEDSPTWSPDGASIAYVADAGGNLDIYVQQIGSGQALRVTDSEADDAQPAWSPDGSRLAFVSARAYPEKRLSALRGMGRWQSFFGLRNGDLWVMPALGGTARRIAQDGYYPAWSPDGKKIAYASPREGRWGLWVRDVDTPGEPRSLAVDGLNVPDVREPAVIHPAWSPDGKWIAFTGGRDPSLRVYVIPSEGGQARTLPDADANAMMPAWSLDGSWLFFSSDRGGALNLWKARFQDGRLGLPRQVTAGSGDDLQARPDPQGKRIAYSSVRVGMDLWEYDLKSGQAIRLTSETTLETNARPSPDDRWLAFASNRLGGNHLWLLERQSGRLTQVSTASSLGLEVLSHWSWDGKFLFYTLFEPGIGIDILQYEVSSGPSRKVYGPMATNSSSFCLTSHDRYLVMYQLMNRAPWSLHRIELASGKRTVLVPAVTGDVACSPDGRWVAFHSQKADDRDIWVVPLAGGPARQLTFGDNEDSHPAWSADSGSIYFVRNHQDIYAVARTGGEPKPITHYRSFSVVLDYPAVSGDGKKVLFTRTDKPSDIYLLEYPREP